MRRLTLFIGAVLAAALAVAPGPAAAMGEPEDWAVNGVPLAPGQQVAVKFASITPIRLISSDPALGTHITCASWKATGTLVGGQIGTGVLVNSKFAACTQLEEGKAIRAKVQLTSVTLHTGEVPPVGSTATTTLTVIGDDCTFKKPHCEPASPVAGTVDGIGPAAGVGGNVLTFPQPALPSSALTIGVSPAELVGQVTFKLKKNATLSQAPL